MRVHRLTISAPMGMGKEERLMQSTTAIVWPASYKGVGIAILKLTDDTYQGVTQDGYSTATYATTQAALADIKAHIDIQRGN